MYMHLFACRFSEFLMRKPPSQSARSQRSLQMYTGDCATGGLVHVAFRIMQKGAMQALCSPQVGLEGRQRPTSRHDVPARIHARRLLLRFAAFAGRPSRCKQPRSIAVHESTFYKPGYAQTPWKILIGVTSFFLTIPHAPVMGR